MSPRLHMRPHLLLQLLQLLLQHLLLLLLLGLLRRPLLGDAGRPAWQAGDGPLADRSYHPRRVDLDPHVALAGLPRGDLLVQRLQADPLEGGVEVGRKRRARLQPRDAPAVAEEFVRVRPRNFERSFACFIADRRGGRGGV